MDCREIAAKAQKTGFGRSGTRWARKLDCGSRALDCNTGSRLAMELIDHDDDSSGRWLHHAS